MGFRPMFLLDAGEPKELVPLKMLYVVHTYCWSLIAYLPIFFEREGYSTSEIGVLLAIPCLCMVVGPPAWGAVADVLHRHKQVHVFCHVTSALLIFAIQFVKSFPLMCATVFAAYCQMVTTLSLLDLSAMKLAERLGGDFGKQRLYGAFGYGVGGYVSGMMASAVDIRWCFTMMLGVSCLSLFLLVRYIPPGYGHDGEDSEEGSDGHREKGLLRSSVRHVARRPDVLALFVIALVTGVSGGFIDSFLFLNVNDLSGDDSAVVSVFVTVETLSEIPFFFLANSMIGRFGEAACIAVSVVAFFARDMVYAVMREPWYVVPLEVLHGVTVGLLVATLTTYVYAAAPRGAAGTMIGLLSAFQRGLGAGIASLVGGKIYDDYSARAMWKVGAYGLTPASLLAVAVFAWLARRRRRGTPAEDLETRLVEREEADMQRKREEGDLLVRRQEESETLGKQEEEAGE